MVKWFFTHDFICCVLPRAKLSISQLFYCAYGTNGLYQILNEIVWIFYHIHDLGLRDEFLKFEKKATKKKICRTLYLWGPYKTSNVFLSIKIVKKLLKNAPYFVISIWFDIVWRQHLLHTVYVFANGFYHSCWLWTDIDTHKDIMEQFSHSISLLLQFIILILIFFFSNNKKWKLAPKQCFCNL